MFVKKSFSSYLKTLFIIGEIVFLSISFVFVSSYIEDKEQGKFISSAKLSTHLVNLYTNSKVRISDYKLILSQVTEGSVSYVGLTKKIANDNENNPFRNIRFVYSDKYGFFPEPVGVYKSIDPGREYENYILEDNGEIYILNSQRVGDYTLFLSYSITLDWILKKNIKATQLQGYAYLGNKSIYWLDSEDETVSMKESVSVTKKYIKIEDYKIGSRPKLVIIENGIGVGDFYYTISDEAYVRRILSERIFIGFMFIVKFVLTLFFTIIVTRTFSKSLVNLVEDSKELANNDLGNDFISKDYSFKEFRSLMKAFSIILKKKNSTQRELKAAKDNMEDTIRERTAELRMAKKKAEDASLAKMNFLAQISHEIRTPMNCIIGFCEIIISRQNPELSLEYSKKIVKESETLLRLINDILDDSKIEHGKMTLSIDKVSVNSFINRIVDLGNPFEGAESITVGTKISPNVPNHIGVDELRLYQVVSNIYFNALKYTEKGTVTIATKCVNDLLEISVTDTGIGIPKNRIGTIFNDYERLDGSLNIRYKGTGLGLSITKKVIELMGGKISVKSTLGSGSCFTILLPFKRVKVNEVESNNINEIERKETVNGKILLVEDYPANRVIAKCHLEYAGYEVAEAENGREALELCDQTKFDLILMDIQMPVLDGFAATTKLKSSDNINKDTPVLAMTANGLKSIEVKCEQIGMDGIILKPIRRKSFIEYVRSFVKEAAIV